ncbi:MAG TPA: cobalamin biosynthesis protein [Dehalococcoidia bacterium]|jgi:cobalt-precorrin 5A hydrolase|nr:cobalamin biosynthesis protein [Dehalococcoidia bacterium]
MARTGIVAISRRGASLARVLHSALADKSILYLERRLAGNDDSVTDFGLPLRPVIERLFDEYGALVLFMPVGAAVRLLAPCIRDKHQDPAVVCVDDAGMFAVSLLSGHLGGADRLAQEIAEILGATAVVTSASHVTETIAVDLLGREFGWTLEADSAVVTRASAAMVNGEPVGVYQETGEPEWWPAGRPLPDNVTVHGSFQALMEDSGTAALIITDRLTPGVEGKSYQQALGGRPVVVYRPRTLVAGMGCRRGVPLEELEELLVTTFQQHNLSSKSLGCIATADLKKDEASILALAGQYSVPLVCYDSQELNSVFELPPPGEGPKNPANSAREARLPTRSEKAHSLLGIWGVAEPAALLASGSRELLVPRQKTTRATIAIARKAFLSNSTPSLAPSKIAGS